MVREGEMMATSSGEAAFRAQLVLPEQRQLYEYWCSKKAADELPSRSDVNPAEIARLLPHISLIDVVHSPTRFVFRLAGTRVRDVYDREVTGLELADFDWDQNLDYWQRTYQRIAETGRPEQGVIRGPCADKEHLVQFWLRLPLSASGNTPDMLLCHDAIVPAETLPGVANLISNVASAQAG